MNAEVKNVESLVSEYIVTGDADASATTARNVRSGLRIVIHVMGMPFDGDTIKRKSLGGSETAAYYQARELARRGHNVVLFTMAEQGGMFDGVQYIPIGQPTQEAPLGADFEHYARHTPHDVLIIQRHPLAFQRQFASKVNIWQTHDLALLRSTNVVNNMMWNIDFVTGVSEWHKKQICEVYGFDPDFVRAVPNGVDLDLYDTGRCNDVLNSTVNPLGAKIKELHGKFIMLYQSRPERGLAHLVRPGGVMDQLRDTNAHLLICGYDNTTAEMAPIYAQWDAWADALPNITRLGALTKAQLAALQKSCDMLVYPSEFEETFCITAVEAMAAGLPMIASDIGALPEVCGVSNGNRLIPLKGGRADEDAFVQCIKTEIERPLMLDRLNQAQGSRCWTWTNAIDKLEAVINEALDRREGSTAAKLRHCIEHSELDIATALAPAARFSDNPIVAATQREIGELYAFTKSSEAYAAHYAKHQGIYYDGPGQRAIGEDVTGSPRFRGAFQLLWEQLDGKEGLRVLDYGCAHGHYLIPFAAAFPQHTFVGMDISARAISAAMQAVAAAGLRNVELVHGDQSALHDLNRALCPRERIKAPVELGEPEHYELGDPKLFDVVFAGEVIEHVPDYMALLARFTNILNPGGRLIATTPFGRWEWMGTEAFRTGREHLHHFDRRDIEELCGDNDVKILAAPAAPDHTGAPLGSWCWSTSVNKPFVGLDSESRANRLAPRETLSACLIVKDGEKTLRRCIESFIDWVDQIVVAIDPTTMDRTQTVLDNIVADFPFKAISVVEGLPAAEHGFHAARNKSIEHAVGDWILWVDADEEIKNPQNLWKYLRPSQHQAIGFQQIHYSSEPAQVLTTDYPCRMFRNNKGIQFYGFVHEHPESKPGDSIPHAIIRQDVTFLHGGYVDEITRRKRYARNLPLLQRDMQEFPTRRLNRFLWLRDIAQGIVFDIERQGGGIGPAQVEQAREGIKLFEQIMEEESGNIRMLIDSLQYYSQCAGCLPGSFEAEFSFACMKEPLRDLAARANAKGRFHSVDVYYRLSQLMIKEATKHYDHKYL